MKIDRDYCKKGKAKYYRLSLEIYGIDDVELELKHISIKKGNVPNDLDKIYQYDMCRDKYSISANSYEQAKSYEIVLLEKFIEYHKEKVNEIQQIYQDEVKYLKSRYLEDLKELKHDYDIDMERHNTYLDDPVLKNVFRKKKLKRIL